MLVCPAPDLLLHSNPLCTMTRLLEVALLPILLLAVLAMMLWDVVRGKNLEWK